MKIKRKYEKKANQMFTALQVRVVYVFEVPQPET